MSKQVKVCEVELYNTHKRHPVYATPTGVKLGVRGKVIRPEGLVSELSKGPARRLRKALRRAGFAAHAGCRRQPGRLPF